MCQAITTVPYGYLKRVSVCNLVQAVSFILKFASIQEESERERETDRQTDKQTDRDRESVLDQSKPTCLFDLQNKSVACLITLRGKPNVTSLIMVLLIQQSYGAVDSHNKTVCYMQNS